MAAHDDLAFDNDVRHLEFIVIKISKLRKKLYANFKWKVYTKKNIPYALRRRVSLLGPVINTKKWDKIIKIQRNRSVKEGTSKFQIMSVFGSFI